MKKRIIVFGIGMVLLMFYLKTQTIIKTEGATKNAYNSGLNEVVNRYAVDYDNEYTIANKITLWDFDGKEAFSLLLLKPYGYVIVCNYNNQLVEANYTHSGAISYSESEKNIYAGINTICTEKDGDFYLINTGEKLDESYVDYQTAIQEKIENRILSYVSESNIANTNLLKANTINQLSNNETSVAEAYFSNLLEYGINDRNTCLVIAMQIIFGYYDVYRNDEFVADCYRSGNGTSEEFHQLLCQYVYGDSPYGATNMQFAGTGLNRYLFQRGICKRVGYCNSNLYDNSVVVSRIISEISSNNPVAAGAVLPVQTDNGYVLSGHYVVIYGYVQDVNSTIFRCHFGDSTKSLSYCNVLVNEAYFNECSYLYDYHCFGNWQIENTTYHFRNCNVCDLGERQMHSATWDHRLGLCRICLYSGASTLKFEEEYLCR